MVKRGSRISQKYHTHYHPFITPLKDLVFIFGDCRIASVLLLEGSVCLAPILLDCFGYARSLLSPHIGERCFAVFIPKALDSFETAPEIDFAETRRFYAAKSMPVVGVMTEYLLS